MAIAPPSEKRKIAVNSGVGAIGGAGSYLVENGFTWNTQEFLGAVNGGAMAGGIGGLAGPAGGTLAQGLGHSTVSAVAIGARTGIGMGANIVGTTVGSLIAGKDVSVVDLMWSAGTGAVGSALPGGPSNSNSMAQLPHFNPGSLQSTFSYINGQRLWGSALSGAAVGLGIDGVREFGFAG